MRESNQKMCQQKVVLSCTGFVFAYWSILIWASVSEAIPAQRHVSIGKIHSSGREKRDVDLDLECDVDCLPQDQIQEYDVLLEYDYLEVVGYDGYNDYPGTSKSCAYACRIIGMDRSEDLEESTGIQHESDDETSSSRSESVSESLESNSPSLLLNTTSSEIFSTVMDETEMLSKALPIETTLQQSEEIPSITTETTNEDMTIAYNNTQPRESDEKTHFYKIKPKEKTLSSKLAQGVESQALGPLAYYKDAPSIETLLEIMKNYSEQKSINEPSSPVPPIRVIPKVIRITVLEAEMVEAGTNTKSPSQSAATSATQSVGYSEVQLGALSRENEPTLITTRENSTVLENITEFKILNEESTNGPKIHEENSSRPEAFSRVQSNETFSEMQGKSTTSQYNMQISDTSKLMEEKQPPVHISEEHIYSSTESNIVEVTENRNNISSMNPDENESPFSERNPTIIPKQLSLNTSPNYLLENLSTNETVTNFTTTLIPLLFQNELTTEQSVTSAANLTNDEIGFTNSGEIGATSKVVTDPQQNTASDAADLEEQTEFSSFNESAVTEEYASNFKNISTQAFVATEADDFKPSTAATLSNKNINDSDFGTELNETSFGYKVADINGTLKKLTLNNTVEIESMNITTLHKIHPTTLLPSMSSRIPVDIENVSEDLRSAINENNTESIMYFPFTSSNSESSVDLSAVKGVIYNEELVKHLVNESSEGSKLEVREDPEETSSITSPQRVMDNISTNESSVSSADEIYFHGDNLLIEKMSSGFNVSDSERAENSNFNDQSLQVNGNESSISNPTDFTFTEKFSALNDSSFPLTFQRNLAEKLKKLDSEAKLVINQQNIRNNSTTSLYRVNMAQS